MMAVGLLVATTAVVAIGDGVADERWIIEPTDEAPNAQALGAAEVERAQKLAKAKQYSEAATLLEQVTRKLPAAVHDCNLALAYLRAKLLTRAKLVWDLSGLRNGERPKWCTGDVSTQLSNTLRTAGFVPLTIEVVPPDAVIEVAGIAMRKMQTVWLPPGPAQVTASAEGRVPQTVTAQVTPPSARITITLEAPPPVVEPDAGVAVPAAPADAAPVVVSPVDAAPLVVQPAPPQRSGTPTAYRYTSLSVAFAGWVGAGVLGVLTYNAKHDANAVYRTDPGFDDAKQRYDRYAWLTVGAVGIGVVATAFAVYFFTSDDKLPAPASVQVGVGEGSVGISYSGTFGGGASP